MPFVSDTFTHLFDWEKDPQRQDKIVNARLEAEFDGIDNGLSAAAARVTVVETAVAAGVADNAVTNAKLADMAAYTIKARNAGTSGDPSDLNISALTEKTVLANADLFLIQDSAAGNAFKKVQKSTIAPGAASDTAAGTIEIAVQSEMEAASSTTLAVTPGRQHYHPSAAKAWARFNASGAVAASYNVTSITDSGVGDWTVNIATDFSSANYCGVCSGGATGSIGIFYNIDAASAAGAFNIGGFGDTDGSAGLVRADPATANEIHAAFFGDQ
jgi:hypothetical protein